MPDPNPWTPSKTRPSPWTPLRNKALLRTALDDSWGLRFASCKESAADPVDGKKWFEPNKPGSARELLLNFFIFNPHEKSSFDRKRSSVTVNEMCYLYRRLGSQQFNDFDDKTEGGRQTWKPGLSGRKEGAKFESNLHEYHLKGYSFLRTLFHGILLGNTFNANHPLSKYMFEGKHYVKVESVEGSSLGKRCARSYRNMHRSESTVARTAKNWMGTIEGVFNKKSLFQDAVGKVKSRARAENPTVVEEEDEEAGVDARRGADAST